MDGRHGRAKNRFETPAPDRRDEQRSLASEDQPLPKEVAESTTR